MRCKACNSPMDSHVRTDLPEECGIVWEDMCTDCRNHVPKSYGEDELDMEYTPVAYTFPTTMDDISDVLEEWLEDK